VRPEDRSSRRRHADDSAEGPEAAAELWLRPWHPSVSAPYGGGEDGDGYNGDVAGLAMRAGLVLSYKEASLADVYVASAALVPPALVHLAGRRDEAVLRGLRAMLAAEQAPPTGLAGVLRRELAFQGVVVDVLGSQTLMVLKDMLHEIIEWAASRLDRRPDRVVRHLAEARTHHAIVSLVEAGRGQAAAALARERTREIERVILESTIADGGLSGLIFGSW
jgi:DNA-binding FadR family transcriptional regulator